MPRISALNNRNAPEADLLADGVELRPMRESDLKVAYSLSLQQNWPHRPEDWKQVFELGDGLVGERDGEVVATGLRIPWGEDYATVGLIIVSPECRGRRLGHRIMTSLLDGLEHRNVLLHATADGRGLYERHNFVRIGEIRQHQGIALPAPLVELKPGWRIRPASKNDTRMIVELDRRARGMDRGKMIERMLAGLATAVVLDDEDGAVGYAVMHRFGRGWVIGPVAAPDAQGAKALIAHLAGINVGKFTRIDVDFDSGLTQWVETLGLMRVDAVTTMVRGTAPAIDPSLRLYTLATQTMA